VRVSGPRAVAVAEPWFHGPEGKTLADARSHHLLHGWIEQDGTPVDEVLAVVMRAPRSYTREDVVEVHCHGGLLAVRTVLRLMLSSGARLAEPGEFTLRAFLNGRMDLTRVEAVADLVRARSETALKVSANQLRGRLYQEISALREDLARVAALVNAGIDFPEEDVTFFHREELTARVERVRGHLEALLERARQGRLVREGLPVAIVGRPNVGKSSLLNALLRENRAIVTAIPGTTRDTLEEMAEIRGLPLRLIDTAGIRNTADEVEREGIHRARRAMDQAELVLLVLDGSEPLQPEDEALLAGMRPGAALAVVNKRDLMPAAEPPWRPRLGNLPWVALSARSGEGLGALEDWVHHWALWEERPLLEDAVITNLRQQQAAAAALEAVRAVKRGLEQRLGDELLAVDLQRSLQALGDIVGETTADDLLNRIFAEFCIGK